MRAIDDVSVRFGEKGMVFLLGKSGSGKSTLLNLCGGLDSPDSGEIIIKGRSSKDFSRSDFDSYRNTFVGFIFQEYNILNEFSVEDNIALALELQGKNKNKEQVRAILEQVELEDFAKRKPNTLSGGQKQRVAIARALVKNPEIIMADEPTGALDSNTGKQVFDTLKKLSKDKLVIVVSHDREFAKIYGDRIIELKDGKIISDVTKTHIIQKREEGNLLFLGQNTLTIRKGAKLSAEDFSRIQEFIDHADKETFLSNAETDIDNFRKAASIDDNGARERFETTQDTECQKTYTDKERNFIRSRLPLRHALRLAASSMKVKPFRLAFTVLLTFIAFTMFGLFSTITFFNEKSALAESYFRTDPPVILMNKEYRTETVYYWNKDETDRKEYTYRTLFTQRDVETFREKYGDSFFGVYDFQSGKDLDRPPFSLLNVMTNNVYYDLNVRSFATASEAKAALQKKMLTDTDLGNIREGEVVIPSYLFEGIKSGKFTDDPDLEIRSPEDILGKTLKFRNETYDVFYGRGTFSLTIAGVYELNLPQKYDKLKNLEKPADMNKEENEVLALGMQAELVCGLYQTVLVSDGFFDTYDPLFSDRLEDIRYFEELSSGISFNASTDTGNPKYIAPRFAAYDENNPVKLPSVLLFGEQKTTLSDDEIILPASVMADDLSEIYEEKYKLLMQQDPSGASANAFHENFMAAQNILLSGSEEATVQDAKNAIAFIESVRKEIGIQYSSYTISVNDLYRFTARPIGIITSVTETESSLPDGIYVSRNVFDNIMKISTDPTVVSGSHSLSHTDYVMTFDAVYSKIAGSMPGRGVLNSIVRASQKLQNDDSYYIMSTPVISILDNICEVMDLLENIFLWIGVTMAVFSMLLLFNFISVSITYKKNEIGILRAVGARSIDVFKIFYSESAIIACICLILSVIASFIVCGVCNDIVAAQTDVPIFVLGPLSWLVMLGIAVVTSFIATFLPVYGIAKKKPVESIRAL